MARWGMCEEDRLDSFWSPLQPGLKPLAHPQGEGRRKQMERTTVCRPHPGEGGALWAMGNWPVPSPLCRAPREEHGYGPASAGAKD